MGKPGKTTRAKRATDTLYQTSSLGSMKNRTSKLGIVSPEPTEPSGKWQHIRV